MAFIIIGTKYTTMLITKVRIQYGKRDSSIEEENAEMW